MFTCKQCSNTYKHFSSLRTHIAKHHVSAANLTPSEPQRKPKVKKAKMGRPKINKCSHCGAKFTTCYSLDRHIKGRCKHNSTTEPIIHTGTSSDNDIVDTASHGLDTRRQSHKTTKNNSNSGTLLDGNHNNLSVDNHVENHDNHIENHDNHVENHLTQNNNAVYIREVHINPMGKENLSHISDADIIRILNMGVNAVPALAKAIMERPENRNIVETDKRNHKATVVNRDGDVEIMDTKKALTMSTTDTVDRIDDYYEKFKDNLPKQNRSIQRMARAHGLDSDEEDESEIPKDETYDAYFKKYMNQIKDNIDVNKNIIISRINKFKEYKQKAWHDKQGLMTLQP